MLRLETTPTTPHHPHPGLLAGLFLQSAVVDWMTEEMEYLRRTLVQMGWEHREIAHLSLGELRSLVDGGIN